MTRILACTLMILALACRCYGGLMINEAVTATEDDWVELYFDSASSSTVEISSLYVTMYYGTNEPLADGPVTLYSHDRGETPWDDRFAVVHLANSTGVDETDDRGDLNGNGVLDLYCSNYFGSLWNSDGVVAIDSDDDPENGGIIDFVAYSNNDGSPNRTVEGYIADACNHGAWIGYSPGEAQGCAVNIGEEGLQVWEALARKAGADTNCREDFSITRYVTPGRANCFSIKRKGCRVFRCLKKRIAVTQKRLADPAFGVTVAVFRTCSLRMRVFSLTGEQVYRSSLMKSLNPGRHFLPLRRAMKKGRLPAGVYICHIEGSSSSSRLTETDTVFLVMAAN